MFLKVISNESVKNIFNSEHELTKLQKYLRLQFIHGTNLNWEEYASKFKEKSRNRLCLFHKLLECKDSAILKL